MFSIELELTTGAVEPEGGKSNALYQNPASTHFECFPDIKWKTFFRDNDVLSIEVELTTGAVKPEGGKSSALYQNPASMYV